MKKPLFHLVRYAIIFFPIIFLIIVLAHTNYYTDRNKFVATNFSTKLYQHKKRLSSDQLQNLISQKGPKVATNQITEHHEWKNIIHQITRGNNQWASLIPNILPYTPIRVQTQLDQAIEKALMIKPNVILQNLALTDSTLKNTDMICKANNLNQKGKLRLASVLQSIHNPSFIYQQQSCLHTLLCSIKHEQSKLS